MVAGFEKSRRYQIDRREAKNPFHLVLSRIRIFDARDNIRI